MQVGVGYSDNPDSALAAAEAARLALEQTGRTDACDLVFLFQTASHDTTVLRKTIQATFGESVKIVGGGAVGTISNDRFGYAGDQLGVAAFWFDQVRYQIFSQSGLLDSEEQTGFKLGQAMLQAGVNSATPVMLFYDAIDQTGPRMRLLMATPLLAGLEKAMGDTLPPIVGAGLQGDYLCTPTAQWTGDGPSDHEAVAIAFMDGLVLDSVIMHGCRPSTGYYTVTKADKQTILEINHQPALRFIENMLGPSIPVDEYAFFLIFGINRGEPWGEYNEEQYASRLCLAIDKERDGIVMFEPDMVEGTQFQVMHRSLDLNYMPPRIESLFEKHTDAEPVFAFYIDCAGRAAGYAGTDLEDALLIQNTVNKRVPLLGIYSGVEIAPVMGVPRPLDWTGVFCLFRVTNNDQS